MVPGDGGCCGNNIGDDQGEDVDGGSIEDDQRDEAVVSY